MSKEEIIRNANKELIESGNLDVIADTFTATYIAHDKNKVYEGHNFIKRWVNQLRTAISGIRVMNVEFFIQTDDTIVWQRTLKGKHNTKMWGINPSEKTITWNEMVVSRFDNEKITEEWIVSEIVGELLSKTPKTK
jgi:predicted ester cyclase